MKQYLIITLITFTAHIVSMDTQKPFPVNGFIAQKALEKLDIPSDCLTVDKPIRFFVWSNAHPLLAVLLTNSKSNSYKEMLDKIDIFLTSNKTKRGGFLTSKDGVKIDEMRIEWEQHCDDSKIAMYYRGRKQTERRRLNGKELSSTFLKRTHQASYDDKLWLERGRAETYTYPIPYPVKKITNGSNSAAFNPKEKTIAGGSGNDVVILNMKTHKLIKTLQGHLGTVQSTTWDPEGTYLASGSADKTIRLWDTETEVCLKVLQETQKVEIVEWSPLGKHLASAAKKDRKIKLWEIDKLVTLVSDIKNPTKEKREMILKLIAPENDEEAKSKALKDQGIL